MILIKNTLKLHKRNCGIKLRLVPYGGGWTDVYINFGKEEHYFVISEMFGDDFQALLRALFFLYPQQNDNECADDILECKYGYADGGGDGPIENIVDNIGDMPPMTAFSDIPWKAGFEWTDEQNTVRWDIERTPNEATDFNIKISININNEKTYEYVVPYKEMCYAVADACTKAIKKHGFGGFHKATYYEDMNIRYLIFLKCVALENMEARELQYFEEKGEGERSNLMKELELLLFDMS